MRKRSGENLQRTKRYSELDGAKKKKPPSCSLTADRLIHSSSPQIPDISDKVKIHFSD